MNTGTTLCGALLGCLLTLTAHAQPAYVIGSSYSFLGETSLKRCSPAGAPGPDTLTYVAPHGSVFRLVDTLAAGDAVIRFWDWEEKDPRRTTFNYVKGDTTGAAYFYRFPKAGRTRTKEVKDAATVNEQTPVDPPKNSEKQDPLVLDTNRRTLGRDRSFIYSIGTNFDFIDNVQVAKTYHDLRVWIPRLREKDKGFGSIFGFEFGFNRFRTFSTPDSATLEYRDVRGTRVITGSDTSFVPSFVTNTVKEKTNTRFDNIGLFLNPTFRLSKYDRKDVFFGATIDLEWQRSVLDRTVLRTYNEVTTESAPDTWDIPYVLNYGDLPVAQETFRTTTDNFYLGGGFRLMYRDDLGTLNMRACAGYSYTMVTPGTDKQIDASEGVFYLLQAEIIESKVSGVKLGTEIRGFFVDNPADPIRAFPRFSLYIAKEFRLSKIAELLKAN